MNLYLPIYNIAELCAQKGINQVVLCPGSRCAPLTLAFARHPKITTRTIPDERSAAFIALGIAQQKKTPTVLVCTSGTAAYNFAPAVAEAYFNETPLLIITADRPSEWIGQHDGQTIYQENLYGKHVKKSYQFPQDYEHADSHWAINRIVNEAINISFQEPKGPVHINAPFREPLYPKHQDEIIFDQNVRVVDEYTCDYTLTQEQIQYIDKAWNSFNNILIVSGQQEYDSRFVQALETLSKQRFIPVIGDLTSNLHPLTNGIIIHADSCLAHAPDEIKQELKPDLLITFGKSTVAKNLKLFLRKYKPAAHWHFQPAGTLADTYQSVTEVFNVTPFHFIDYIKAQPFAENFNSQKQHNYKNLWEAEERRVTRTLHEFFPHQELGELEVIKEVMTSLPANCNLHLANSMSVRYANLIGLNAERKGIQVFSNRGTSGIDGCTSTAMGHAVANPKRLNFLITGDLAFFYDRNAFWNNYPTPNLRILLLNNHGGIIFKMIDGPANMPEADEYFVTHQPLNARKLCEEYNLAYLHLDNRRKLKNLIKDFTETDGQMKIMEFESQTNQNTVIFDALKKKIKQLYQNQ